MAATITEKARYRMQNVGFGVMFKVVTTGVNDITLTNCPSDIASISVQDIKSESAPIITQSGTDVTLSYNPAPSTTLYVDVVGV